MSSNYNSFLTTKTNNVIPVFTSGRTMESKYNPINEAERLLDITENSSFYIVLGVGSGIFLEKLSNINPYAKILAVEVSNTDFDFLSQLDSIKYLYKNPNIIFSDLDTLSDNILDNYIPAFYGNIKIVEHRAWIQENINCKDKIQNIIKESLHKVSSDFSVQAHFGKIWHKNVINNYSLLSKSEYKSPELSFDLSKTAAIIAAGPSLNETIIELKENRENYTIFSTDTAYSTLLKHNIIPEYVISIDGQMISHSHFIQNTNIFQNTTFIFDLCANFSAAQHILNNHGKLFYITSGHPLSECISAQNPNSFIKLNTGSGTVTIAALDFAIKAGFVNLKIFGGDFAYINGASYVKGTYLDKLYNLSSNRLCTFENTFDKLLYRTELITLDENTKTTEVLQGYRYSLETFLHGENIDFSRKDNIYYLKSNKSNTISTIAINYLLEDLIKDLNNSKQKEINTINDLNNLEITLLPLISWLRYNDNKNSDFNTLLEIAHSYLPRI